MKKIIVALVACACAFAPVAFAADTSAPAGAPKMEKKHYKAHKKVMKKKKSTSMAQ